MRNVQNKPIQRQKANYWLSGTGGRKGKRRCPVGVVSILPGENVLEICCTTGFL